MGALEEGGATYTLECGHEFHMDCILSWARSDSEQHDTCPVCRATPGGGGGFTYHDMGVGAWARYRKNLERSSSMMSEDERSLLAYLLKEEQKAQTRHKNTSDELKQFSREFRREIQKYKRLTRNNWSTRYQAQQARRQVAATFPMLQIIVPVSRARRATVAVVRRSPRLLAAAEAGEAP